MPILSIFSDGYGKAIAILEYKGGNDAFITDQQDYKYRACAVIDEETGKSMEYRNLLKDPKHRETWSRAAANEHGRLFNGVGKNADGTQRVKETNTRCWIKKITSTKRKKSYICQNSSSGETRVRRNKQGSYHSRGQPLRIFRRNINRSSIN
jgi:hypothetical protein